MRIKIDLPEIVHFTCKLQVRVDDLNYSSYLGHDSLVSFLHEARNQLLASVGYHELNVAGACIIVGDYAVQYKIEAFNGDQLSIDCSVVNFEQTSADIYYKVTNQSQQEIVRAKTGISFIDAELRKTVSVPNEFKNQF